MDAGAGLPLLGLDPKVGQWHDLVVDLHHLGRGASAGAVEEICATLRVCPRAGLKNLFCVCAYSASPLPKETSWGMRRGSTSCSSSGFRRESAR